MSNDPLRFVHPRASQVIWQLARALLVLLAPLGHGWIGRGWDTTGEHSTGRALDIIIATKVGQLPTKAQKAIGNLLVAWLIRHADQLHIRHIIWDGRIWKRRYRNTPTAWTPLRNRRGNSDWHYDHIHVYLDDANGTVPDAPLVPVHIIQKEIKNMDPQELVNGILLSEVTANGKRQPIVQHFADMVVATHAQSLAVTAERERDKAHLDQVLAELGKLREEVKKK